MGPSLGRLGDYTGSNPVAASKCAAMGPSLGRLGDLQTGRGSREAKKAPTADSRNGAEPRKARRPHTLTCKRGGTSPSRNGAEPRKARRREKVAGRFCGAPGSAAMGPSLGRLGDADTSDGAHRDKASRNGAEPRKARRQSHDRSRRRRGTTRRNGAEPRKARRLWEDSRSRPVVAWAAMGPSLGRLGDRPVSGCVA